jgi:hypothetical protein
MCRRLALIALLVGMAQSSAAQTPYLEEMNEGWFDKLLSQLHVHEMIEDTDIVVVHASRTKADGRQPGMVIACERSGSDREWFAFRDLLVKTDDRWTVKPGTCVALLAAARRRKDAQGR